MKKFKRIRFDANKLTSDQLAELNEDWVKVVGWDLYVTDERGQRKPVTTLNDLLRWLGFNPDRLSEADVPMLRDAVQRFENLPVALGMPQPLHDQWLKLLEVLGVEWSPYRKAATIEW